MSNDSHEASIDGLRGFAILGVFAAHVLDHSIGMPVAPSLFLRYIDSGRYGVQLFFLVSAFTIFRSHTKRIATATHPRRDFYIRRFFRIIPLWWIAILLYGLVWEAPRGVILSTLFFYFPFDKTNLFDPGWSIAVEESFYILFPMMFPLFATPRRTVQWLALSFGISLLWRAFAPSLFGGPQSWVNHFPLGQLYAFPLGILVYYISFPLSKPHSLFQKSKSNPLFDILSLGSLSLVPFFHPILIPFLMVFPMIGALSPYSLIGRLARSKVLGQVGKGSYSIYLFHLFIIWALKPLGQWLFLEILPTPLPVEFLFLIWFPIVMTPCLVLASLSYTWLEMPSVKWGGWVIGILGRRHSVIQVEV